MYNMALASDKGLCYYIHRGKTHVRDVRTSKYNCTRCTDTISGVEGMTDPNSYFLVKKKALPEVLLKVVEAKSLFESEKVQSVQEAVDAVGISRSSFYKYKDDIFTFHDDAQGKTITLTFQMDDRPGLLAELLKIIAIHGANILTIHQSIPINSVASLSISVQVLQTTQDVAKMIEEMESKEGVHHVKILAKE